MKKMIGTSCHPKNANVTLMKEAGIEWVRAAIGFPFLDKDMKEINPRYFELMEIIDFWRDNGFKVMGITPLYGMMYAQKGSPSLEFRRYIPEWVGSVNDPEFYEIMEKSMEYVGRQLKDTIEYYQISNEMDITRFRGEMTQEQAAEYMRSCAKGIKAENPNAKVGINPSNLKNEESIYFYKTLYAHDSDVTFDYAGIDYYFGSHHPGTPFDWIQAIEEVYEIARKPVIISEWGYSSIGQYLKDGWPEEPYRYPNENGEFWVCARNAWAYAWKEKHDEQVQAEYFWEAMKIFAQNEHVIGCFEYDWQDDPVCFCGRSNCPHECGWGMVDSEGKPKPAYYAFKKAVEELF